MGVMTVDRISKDFMRFCRQELGTSQEALAIEKTAGILGDTELVQKFYETRGRLSSNVIRLGQRITEDLKLEREGGSVNPDEKRVLEIELLVLGFDFFRLKEQNFFAEHQLVGRFVQKISDLSSQYDQSMERVSDLFLRIFYHASKDISVGSFWQLTQESMLRAKKSIQIIASRVLSSKEWKDLLEQNYIKLNKREEIGLTRVCSILSWSSQDFRLPKNRLLVWGIVKSVLKLPTEARLLSEANSSLDMLSAHLDNLGSVLSCSANAKLRK